MRQPLWKAYLAVTLAAIAAFFATPAGSWLQTGCFVAVGIASAATIVAGIRLNRPTGSLPWLLFAAGIGLNAAGTFVETFLGRVLHYTDTFPSVADAFYLALYPALIAGLALLIRRRTAARDLATLVDTTTITTGLGLLSWVFLIHPAATDTTLGLLGHAVSVAYPVGDVVLLAMMVRLLLGAGIRNASFRFMTGSLLLFLAGDAAWATVNQVGWSPGPAATNLLQMTFLTAYALFGAAALHPSVRDVGERASAPPARLSPALLVLLTTASMIAPGILAVEVARHRVTDGVAIVVGSVALFLLVVTRMAQLLRQVEAQARLLRDLATVDELTGLPNRRGWAGELAHALERARRDSAPLTVALIDVDNFKRFNDELGHPAGDRLLKSAAAAWSGALRAVDCLARYAGDEFVALLPDADEREARQALERMQAAMPAGQTLSGGVATWDGVELSDELIARADRALYEAKRAGRNRIEIAAQEPETPVLGRVVIG